MPYFANTYFVTVDGASPGIRQSFSPIGVAGDALGFDLSQNHDGRPTFAEQLAPNTYLAFLPTDGLAGTSVSPGRPTFSTTFDGAVEYCVLKSEMEGSNQCTPSQAVTRVRCESQTIESHLPGDDDWLRASMGCPVNPSRSAMCWFLEPGRGRVVRYPRLLTELARKREDAIWTHR